jgi:hypothetical protein
MATLLNQCFISACMAMQATGAALTDSEPAFFRATSAELIDGGPGSCSSSFLETFERAMGNGDSSIARGSAFIDAYIHLYNGSLHPNPATTQLLLDDGAGYPMTYAELVLPGAEMMQDRRGSRDAEAIALLDGIYLEGLAGSGALASGQGVSLASIPVPAPFPVLGAGVAYGLSRLLSRLLSRRLHRRLRRRLSGLAS